MPELVFKDSRDIAALLVETIGQVRKGQIGTREANAVGYLIGILYKVNAQRDFEDRLAALEECIGAGKCPEGLFDPADE